MSFKSNVASRLMSSSGIINILFRNAEPGVFYDPSAVANLDWRKNLLTYTEQFDNSAWSKTNVTVTANTTAAPDGTLTADTIVQATGTRALNSDGPYEGVTLNGDKTFSVSAKQNTARYLVIGFSNGSGYTATANFDLQTGVLTGAGMHPSVCSSLTTSIQGLGNGWYRCSIGLVGSTNSVNNQHIAGSTTGGSGIYYRDITGDGTSSIYIWGAQLEKGSVATDYQRITDVVTETFANCPYNTLFQDSAGTTPVTTPGQAVALMLDKSQGLALGPELVTNGTFDTNTNGWTQVGGGSFAWDPSGGIACTDVAGADCNAQTNITTVAGRTYRAQWTVRSAQGGWLFRIRNSTDYQFGYNTATGTFTAYFTASVTGTNTVNILSADTDKTVVFDNISVKLLAGNHATQATSTQRPIYGINPIVGTRNLLTYTEQFDNAAWSKIQTTVLGDNTTAPDGTTTADKLIQTAILSAHAVTQNLSIPAGSTRTVYAKAAGYNFCAMTYNNSAPSSATYNLTTGAITNIGANVTSTSATNVGNGWWRLSMTVNAAATFIQDYVLQATGFAAEVGDGTSGIYIWGAQLETGSTATAYQKVVSQYEVTEVGVQSASYLAFDGVDDGMVTGTITPGIDKVQVFAGVRKLSANPGMIVEASTNCNFTNGTFYLVPGETTTGGGSFYCFGSRGTSFLPIDSPANFTAPITNVVTGLGDISLPVATLRVNGGQVATSAASQGTGNYLAYPLNIGRRGGASLPFNGRLYSLITRFGANLNSIQISNTERYVNKKTGAY